MAKVFNVTADCKPNLHYMVKLDTRLAAILQSIVPDSMARLRRFVHSVDICRVIIML